MKKIVVCITFILLLSFYYISEISFAEEAIVIKRGTEVLVKVMEKIRSNKVKTGQTIQFLVERNVKNEDGFTIIEQGAFAYGTVVRASSAGLFGAGGTLEFSIDSVEAYNGRIVPLTGTKENDGGSTTGAVVASAILLSPFAILFRGTNAVIDAGTIFRAYVAKNTVISGEVKTNTQNYSERFQESSETNERLNEMLERYEAKKREQE